MDGVNYQTCLTRLQHPDDELGGMLLPALPQLVIHRVDPWSPLWPPDVTCQDLHQWEGGKRDPPFKFNGDSRNPWKYVLDEVSISEHLGSAQLEFLCLFEGIDSSTSCTVQARYSYTCDDSVGKSGLQKCVSRASD